MSLLNVLELLDVVHGNNIGVVDKSNFFSSPTDIWLLTANNNATKGIVDSALAVSATFLVAASKHTSWFKLVPRWSSYESSNNYCHIKMMLSSSSLVLSILPKFSAVGLTTNSYVAVMISHWNIVTWTTWGGSFSCVALVSKFSEICNG